MNRLGHRSIDWLVRRLASRTRGEGVTPGVEAALDGMTAVALAESAWCDTAALGGTFPAAAGSRVWARLADGRRRNAFGASIGSVPAESAAGALGAAIGAGVSGLRSTAFVSGHDLAGVGGLLAYGAARRAPMVVHVATRATADRSVSFGGGHGSLLAAADTGWGQLFAASVQEVVDLALIARLASERSLVPFMVASDGLETAAAVQDVRVPELSLVHELLGQAGWRGRPPTPSQRVLFGEYRASVPRWHDLDDPSMVGPGESASEAGAGAAAERAFFAAHVEEALAWAYEAVGARTGRTLGPVLAHRTNDARIVLVTIGAVTEVACAVADRLREKERTKVGVVGIRQLRPWPAGAIRAALGRAGTVVVLERTDSALASDGPLTREVRACCAPDVRVCRCVHGIGGSAAGAADVAEVCREVEREPRELVYLGVAFLPDKGISPKGQATIDAVRRSYPGLSKLSIKATAPLDVGAGRGSVRVSVVRGSGDGGDALSGDAARLVHALVGGRLRGLTGGATPGGHGTVCVDRVCVGPKAVVPEVGTPADVVIVEGASLPVGSRVMGNVRDGGVLIVGRERDGSGPSPLCSADLRDAAARGIRIVAAPFEPAKAYERPAPAWRRHEALLGALAGVLGTLDGLQGVTAKKAGRARESLLGQDEADDAAERTAAFLAGVEQWSEPGIDAFESADEPERAGPPELLTRLGASKHPVHDLPAFWDRRGMGADEAGRASMADPFAAVPTVPALSAALRPVSDPEGELVEFDPATCDGFGAVWTSCPDGSVGAVAIGAADILKTGIRLATQAGHSADALTPILSKLGSQINKRAVSADRPPATVREASEGAFEWMIEKMSPPEDRREALVQGFRHVMDAIGMLPIARTVPFFDEPERESAGSGEFLVVAANPDACKSARTAVGECEGRGLRVVQRDDATLERARLLWRIFEALPDTSGATIERVGDHPGVGPLAAIMLSKSCAQAMAPGDASEAGSGARLALRSVLAACEAEVQPRVQRLLGEIRELRDRLSNRVRETLVDALPDTDLDALGEGLRALGREDVDLAALNASVSRGVESRTIDAIGLERLIEPARALADLEWRLSEGTSRLGRARVGMAIEAGSGTLWAIASPLNPFQGPVTVGGAGWTSELARGLCEGHMSVAVEAIRIVRWARAELERPGEAERDAARLGALAWSDLTEAERAICPPLLLVGDDESMGTGGLGSLLWLLSSDLPVKVVLLTGAGGAPDASASLDPLTACPAAATTDGALLALLARRAYVARCSVAAGDHLVESARRGVAFDGPALLHVHAPSPRRHQFAPEHMIRQAALCVQSRTHCLFRFNPQAGGVFGSCLDLTGNPDPLEMLAKDEEGRAITPLDWAITEGRFREHFKSEASGASAIPAAQYLKDSGEERTGKAPLIVNRLDKSKWIASASLVSFADERLRLWRTLQELAGLVTPFTQRVREDAERAVAGERENEIAALNREHEAALAELRAGFEGQAVDRVREGLMRLAGYGDPADEPAENGSG